MLIRRDFAASNKDLHLVYRPFAIEEVVGNDVTKKLVTDYFKHNNVPHTLLISGPSGCGKTTFARIIALGLNCVNNTTGSPCLECDSCKATLSGSNPDVSEINVGKTGGKADVDAIVNTLAISTFMSKNRVIIFDEAHELTSSAKNLLLKEMEEADECVYIIFCTDQPTKLVGKSLPGSKGAFLNRCTYLTINTLTESETVEMLANISQFEGHAPTEEVLSLIASYSGGVPREAIVNLSKILTSNAWTVEEASNLLEVAGEEETTGFKELVKLLTQSDFRKVINASKKLFRVDKPESIRLRLLVYLSYRLSNVDTALRTSTELDILSTTITYEGKVAEALLLNMLYKIWSLK